MHVSMQHHETQSLFSRLVAARGDERRQIYTTLHQHADPQVLLQVALEAYAQHGNEDRLTLAAAILGEMGALARPALSDLERIDLDKRELFIDVIDSLRTRRRDP